MEKKLFVSDEPIEELTKDAFGHKVFVETLYRCVRDCDCRINIGLFGKWGVGKTSIVRLLAKKLQENDKDIKVFLFDAWKYSHSSLHHELILGLNKKLGKLDQEKLESDIYNIREEEAVPNRKGFKANLRSIWLQFGGSIIITISLYILLIWLHITGVINSILFTSLVAPAIAPLAYQILKEIATSRVPMGKVIVLPSKSNPEQLQRMFGEVVDSIVNNKANNRLIIVVDNLDRCSGESAIEMFGAIKNLMEHEKCVYLFPCDQDALINHLTSVRHYNDRDAREFLRKFFQTTLTMPSLISHDLEKFTRDLLSQLEIEYGSQVLEVIISAFLEDPRKIKQFLNNLTMQYLAAQEREKVGIFESGEITNNKGYLAKMLVIRQEFPSFYEEIDYREDVLEEVETYISKGGDTPTNKNPKNKQVFNKTVFTDNPELEEFLRSTRLIIAENVSSFLKLNRESFTSVIPNSQEFKLQVNRGNVEYVLENLNKLEQEDEKTDYVKDIIKVINDERRFRHYDWVFNGVDVLVRIHHQVPDSFNQEIARKIGDFSTLQGIRQHLDKFDYNLMFPILRNMRKVNREDVLVGYVSMLSLDAIDVELVAQIVNHYDIVPETAIRDLNKILVTAYNNNRENGGGVIRRINENPDASNKLITSDLIEEIANSIDDSATQENQQAVDLYFELRSRASTSTRLAFIKKLLSIISANKTTAYDGTKQFGLQNLVKLDTDDIPNEGVNELYAILDEFTGLIAPPNDKLQFVEASFKFFNRFSESQKEQYLQNRVLPVVNSGDVSILKRTIELSKQYDVTVLHYEFLLDGFINRVKSNTPDLELISLIVKTVPKKGKEKVKDMIIHLINHQQPTYHNTGLESFRQLSSEFTATQISEISDACLQKSVSVPQQEKNKYVAPIIELFEKNTTQFKRRVADFIAEFITNDDANVSSMGIDYYNKIRDSVEENKRKAIIIRVMRVIEQKVARDMINNDTERLLNLVIVEQSILDSGDLVGLIDALHALLNEAKPKEIRLFGIKHLAQISEFYKREEIVLATLKSYLEDPDEEIKEQAKQAVEQIIGKTSNGSP